MQVEVQKDSVLDKPAYFKHSGEEILRVENLGKHFQVDTGLTLFRPKTFLNAVDGVSFSLRKGETLGIVGESGCGKSTLGRTILNLHDPTFGEVYFKGRAVNRFSKKQMFDFRRSMQIIFQDPYSSLNPRMKVSEILTEPFLIHNICSKSDAIQEIEKLIQDVGLDKSALSKYPHQFSGGQRQRIGIARALALKPEIIVADEPVSALDVSIQSQILNLLCDLKEKHQLSFIFIAHDLAVVEHICDTVAVMYLGKVVEYSSCEQLFNRPRHPYTQALLNAIPRPFVGKERKRKSRALSGELPNPMSPPMGCDFNPRCHYAQERCLQFSPKSSNLGTETNPNWVACHYPCQN